MLVQSIRACYRRAENVETFAACVASTRLGRLPAPYIVTEDLSILNHKVTPSLLRFNSPAQRKVMDREEAVIDLVADGKLPCFAAARALTMTPVEFAALLNSRGIVVLRLTADELQRELEAAESRTQLAPPDK